MDIATYVRSLIGDASIGPTALEANVSMGGLHNIISGKVTAPKPQTLACLAKHFGNTEVERRLIYAQMMELSGYFTLLPHEMLTAFQALQSDNLVVTPTNSDTEFDLFEEVNLILERADREQWTRIALDVMRRFYPEEAQEVLQNLQRRVDTEPTSRL
jgi:hypothetical protein